MVGIDKRIDRYIVLGFVLMLQSCVTTQSYLVDSDIMNSYYLTHSRYPSTAEELEAYTWEYLLEYFQEHYDMDSLETALLLDTLDNMGNTSNGALMALKQYKYLKNNKESITLKTRRIDVVLKNRKDKCKVRIGRYDYYHNNISKNVLKMK